MQATIMELETRKPCPLSVTYRDLVGAIPLLKPYCFFVNGTTASVVDAKTLEEDTNFTESLRRNPPCHWVPGPVFSSLNGERLGDSCVVYTCESEALADLNAVWSRVDTTPKA